MCVNHRGYKPKRVRTIRAQIMRPTDGILLFHSSAGSFIALLESREFYKANKDNIPVHAESDPNCRDMKERDRKRNQISDGKMVSTVSIKMIRYIQISRENERETLLINNTFRQ